MAGAKKAASRNVPTTPASAPPVEEIPIKYDPVMIALSKAEAARDLLVRAEEFFDDGEGLEWIEGFADGALVEALAEARAAYVKAVGNGAAADSKAGA